MLWKADQKREREDVSSILSSLNESRDDSVDVSLISSKDDIDSIIKDDASSWNVPAHDELDDKVPSSIVDSESEVASVFQMGTEKFMGSEKHYLSENFNLSVSNLNPDESEYQVDPKLKALKGKVKRVSRRKDGFVKTDYLGKATMPVEENKETKLKNDKRTYTGSITYTGPKENAMVSENEINNASRLHNYKSKEGEGVPLNSFDQKVKPINQDITQESEISNTVSFFAALDNMKPSDIPYSVYRNNKIREGETLLRRELEPIYEENNKSDAITESKTLERNSLQKESTIYQFSGKSVELKELDNSQKYPQSKLIKSAHNIKTN